LTIEREIFGNRWNNKSISLGDWELVIDNTINKELPSGAFVSSKTVDEKAIFEESTSTPLSPDSTQKILNKMTDLIKGKFNLIRTNRESGERPASGTRPFLVDPDTRTYLTAIGQNPARAESRIWSKYKKSFQGFSSYSLEMRGSATYRTWRPLFAAQLIGWR
jgi:hypothetical protein